MDNQESLNVNLARAISIDELAMSDCDNFDELIALIEKISSKNLSDDEKGEFAQKVKTLLDSTVRERHIQNIAGTQLIGNNNQFIIDGEAISKIIDGVSRSLKEHYGQELGSQLFIRLCQIFVEKH